MYTHAIIQLNHVVSRVRVCVCVCVLAKIVVPDIVSLCVPAHSGFGMVCSEPIPCYHINKNNMI